MDAESIYTQLYTNPYTLDQRLDSVDEELRRMEKKMRKGDFC